MRWCIVSPDVDLPFTPPFDADGLLGFLAARTIDGVDAVEGRRYHRAEVDVEVAADRVVLRGGDPEVARRLLGLGVDPAGPDGALGADPLLGPLVRARPGARVPGAVSAFEVAVRAIVGQQVSVAGARTVLGRLVAASGAARAGRFPTPAELLAVPDQAYAMPAGRRRALQALAAGGEEVAGDPDALLALPGVGPWTVAYVALRTGDPDAFQPTDLGVLRGLRSLGGPDDARDVAALAERWRPFRAFAQLHLWRRDEVARCSRNPW